MVTPEGPEVVVRRILDDLQVFVEMTEAINSDLDLDRVLQSVTDTGTRLSGARFGAFFYEAVADDDLDSGLRVVSGDGAGALTQLSVPRITELFTPTFAGRETVRLVDPGSPHDDAAPRLGFLATPVVARSGEVLGALIFGHPDHDRFDDRSEDVVRLVATQAAVAIENARHYARELAARRVAEQAAERLLLLQQITSRLARATDREEVLRAVTETLVGPLGALRVGVYLADGDVYRAVAAASSGRGDDGPSPQAPQTAWLPRHGDNPVAVSAEERRPLVHGSLADLAARFPDLGASLSGIEATVVLPLAVGPRTLGALALAWREPRHVDAVEVDWLSSAAEQLALALRQVELRESEGRAQEALRDSAAHAISVSQTLQRSLLPLTLPAVDALAVAVRYVPGSVDAEVGGDWYDVIATPDGGVVLVIGDVQGHSVSAAAVMGQLRVALYAYLVEGHAPHAALSRVNRVMETLQTEAIATCCLVGIDPATGQASVVRAGHTLPLLWRSDGTVEELDAEGGIPLGVLPDAEWPTTELRLGAGDRVLLYTDGLVEVPGVDLDLGVDALVDAVGATHDGHPAAPRPRQERLEADVDEVLAAVGVRSRDDVALLACEYAGPASLFRRADLEVASVTEVASARAFADATLRSWGLRRVADPVRLLVTEMVTNALVHTEGSASLELRRLEHVVRVMVTDASSRVPRPRPVDEDAPGGRGMLLIGALATEWGVEPSGGGKTVWADVRA
ncbi:Histidine kinase-like ATPase domain-containing protein [Nocardioides scoriae]|uniref:Histidine kinase-like ATPase domain-containing protein n=1 Tax=Nocardioides scoriae TaxID=642780 RepID=A0A1H1P7M8_9ACTN|nr:Histidine kinase-like ATPase domain-containing protein [Nocardioides scoriae]